MLLLLGERDLIALTLQVIPAQLELQNEHVEAYSFTRKYLNKVKANF